MCSTYHIFASYIWRLINTLSCLSIPVFKILKAFYELKPQAHMDCQHFKTISKKLLIILGWNGKLKSSFLVVKSHFWKICLETLSYEHNSSLDCISPKHISRKLLRPIALISHCSRQLRWVESVWSAVLHFWPSTTSMYMCSGSSLIESSVWLLLDRPDEWVFNQEKLCGGEDIMQFYVVLCSIPTRIQMWDFI